LICALTFKNRTMLLVLTKAVTFMMLLFKAMLLEM